jgi:hypothetical protein
MFSLAINFGASGIAWSFLFDTKDRLNAVISELTRPAAMHSDSIGRIVVTDDHGTTASIKSDQINGWITEDMDATKKAAVIRSMHQAHIQAEFQVQAQSDRTLDVMRGGGGTGIIQPFPRQGRAS